jgi:hypothetical protein
MHGANQKIAVVDLSMIMAAAHTNRMLIQPRFNGMGNRLYGSVNSCLKTKHRLQYWVHPFRHLLIKLIEFWRERFIDLPKRRFYLVSHFLGYFFRELQQGISGFGHLSPDLFHKLPHFRRKRLKRFDPILVPTIHTILN